MEQNPRFVKVGDTCIKIDLLIWLTKSLDCSKDIDFCIGQGSESIRFSTEEERNKAYAEAEAALTNA